MKYILIPALIVLMVMVVVSLVLGIAAFLQSTRHDLESGEAEVVREMQLKQNRMMFARIKFQALAVVVVAVLLAMAR